MSTRHALGRRPRRRERPLTKRHVTIAALLPVAIAGFGLGYATGYDHTGLGPRSAYDAMSVTTIADGYTRSGEPDTAAGAAPGMLVGGSAEVGVAVAYVKFTVTDTRVREARLRLSIVDGDPEQLIEVASVDARWDENELTEVAAPPNGRVLDAAFATGAEVGLDVSGAVRGAGTYAFAISSPDDGRLTQVYAKEGRLAPRLEYRVTMPVTPGASGSSAPAEALVGEPDPLGDCELGPKLVPTCGALWGVAPGAHTKVPGKVALERFERRTGRSQDIYHAYHKGFEMFPTPDEIAIARHGDRPRILFLNWKPQGATWGEIAAGDPETDAYLDRLALYLKSAYREPFFFTVHHEPENDVSTEAGSGRTAADYAAMYRHVVERLRANGVRNAITVMVYMAYLDWAVKSWHADLYPGDDVVDWVAWDTYAYSDPGYGYGDFAEMVDRVDKAGEWPGYYRWAAESFPDKPLMLAEWGVWKSPRNPGHQADLLAGAESQLAHFPRLKALVYFETPDDKGAGDGRDSRVDTNPGALSAYKELGASRHFPVRLVR